MLRKVNTMKVWYNELKMLSSFSNELKKSASAKRSAKNLPFTRVQVIALVLIEKGMAVAGLQANV